jgi:hypothetical protein
MTYETKTQRGVADLRAEIRSVMNQFRSLIPLSDLPVRAQSPPCFSWKISLFSGEKQGSSADSAIGVLRTSTP